MRPPALTFAERGVRLLAATFRQSPPPGVTAQYVERFFERFSVQLAAELAALLEQLAEADARVRGQASELDLPPDEWPVSARTAANLAAIRLLMSGVAIGPEERLTLLRYSGWGGLSLEAAAGQLPPEARPESRGVIHEYYTPTIVAREVARVLRPQVLTLPRVDGGVLALEPSAGIGRLIHALSGPGFEPLRWTAVEYSRVSARLLAAVRPDIRVYEGPFERWIATNESLFAGKLGLAVSNPPYGPRGASITEDANKAYREKKAYVYFLLRVLDLLAPGGLGVFLIPYGFLTGRSAALAKLRERVLRRHHLMVAFRLPSRLFPGANLVTDLLFFRARGGEVPEVLPDDLDIVAGRYFARHPHYILGTERGTAEDEDDITRKPRRGYEVDGTFTVLPEFIERPICATCAVTPFYTAPDKPRRRPSDKEALPAHLQAAMVLGERVAHYLGTLARAEEASIAIAAALYAELREALLAWQQARTAEASEGQPRSPHRDRALIKASKDHAELVSFLSAFDEGGELVSAFREPPKYEPRYQGSADDIAAQADFLYRQRRRLTLDALREFRQQLGVADLNMPLHTALIEAGWCFDGGAWFPEADYYTGALWPKYDRAKALADQGDAQAAAQVARLLAAIRPQRIADISPEPRMPWVPLPILRAWLSDFTDAAVPPLVRDGGLLRLEEAAFSQTKEIAGQRLAVAFGYLNHDFTLFTPPATKQVDPATGEEESAASALSRARVEYGERARRHFIDYLTSRPELVQEIEEGYNRVFRGYVEPTHSADDLHIARWRGRIVLKPHQRAGARRLIANNGGLLGFDVGVGKTYTGIATIAALRQAGRAKRPIVIVPNTIIWKWHKEIRAALPDYRVLVVGSERYIGRNGVYTSRIDTPQERALKWRQFQAGEFDVALVTYSVFARNRLRAESVREWMLQTPGVLRMVGLNARAMLDQVKGKTAGGTAERPTKARKKTAAVSAAAIEKLVGKERAQRLTEEERARAAEEVALQRDQAREAEVAHLLKLVEGLTDFSERERAVFAEAMERWIAERIEMNEEPDPGIYWEDLQCDLLVLDEAQNMKNLWPVQQREAGVPKYLGAITEGSDRAWNFALRAALVRKRTGGSGVVLLSATPAKNSPLEYYTLLGYVDGEAWTRLGITDPEVFISRYLRLEVRQIVKADLKAELASVVAGFQNLDELRDVVFRYAEFRTAEEVGLKLPETRVEQVRVPMSEAQIAKYEDYVERYQHALQASREDPRKRYVALGLLQRMALVAIHPELDSGPLNKDGKPEWSWQNARTVRDPSCPKLDKVRDLILAMPDCGHLVFCDNVAVHFWLKELLVQGGFPEDRIAIFNADQAPNPARRQLLAERFNGVPPVLDEDGNVEQEGIPPQYDLVIANATAYEGIDLHVRTCQVYHIDLPWEPATLQQRNGRAVRQGNLQAVIRIFYLLSDKSMDAVRFSMIIGKLGWMRDILKSADRETNNPGAQAEMNPEELLLYLARDPEQARAAIEEQKRMQEEETRRRVQQQAWTSLRGITTRAQSLSRTTDETLRTQIHREMGELRAYLAQVPAEVWPWFFLSDVAMREAPMFFGGSASSSFWALYQGARIYRAGTGFEVGRIQGDAVGVRLLGEFAWESLSQSKLDQDPLPFPLDHIKPLLANLRPSDFHVEWPLEQDHAELEPKLRQAIHQLRAGDFDLLGLKLAPDTWRRWLWERFQGLILDALSHAPRSMPFLLPLREGDRLRLVPGKDITGRMEAVIPFTADAFGPFTTLAATAGHKWSELNMTSLAWWGRNFPRGILREAESAAPITIQTGEGPKQVRAVLVSRYFAVTYSQERGPDHPDGPLYVITHLASGLAAAQSFTSSETARAAVQYLESLEVNWEAAEPDGSRYPANLKVILAWIRSQKTAPTLADIKKKAAAA